MFGIVRLTSRESQGFTVNFEWNPPQVDAPLRAHRSLGARTVKLPAQKFPRLRGGTTAVKPLTHIWFWMEKRLRASRCWRVDGWSSCSVLSNLRVSRIRGFEIIYSTVLGVSAFLLSAFLMYYLRYGSDPILSCKAAGWRWPFAIAEIPISQRAVWDIFCGLASNRDDF